MDIFFATEKFTCLCVRFEELLVCSLEYDITTMDTRSWSYIDYFIGSRHDVFVMFDNDNGIAEVDEFSKVVDKESTVARMETDRRLIEDIGDTLEASSYLGGETDTLRFAS